MGCDWNSGCSEDVQATVSSCAAVQGNVTILDRQDSQTEVQRRLPADCLSSVKGLRLDAVGAGDFADGGGGGVRLGWQCCW